MTLSDELRSKLEDVSERVFARDMSIVDTFWSGGKFCLYGSEANEIDETRDDLHRHMSEFFAKPYRARFLFNRLSVDQQGDMAWVNAVATLLVVHPDRTAELPYRLFALFQKIEGAWHWRVFSGSEPAQPSAA